MRQPVSVERATHLRHPKWSRPFLANNPNLCGTLSDFNSWRQQCIVAQRAGRSKSGTQRSIFVGLICVTYFLTVLSGEATAIWSFRHCKPAACILRLTGANMWLSLMWVSLMIWSSEFGSRNVRAKAISVLVRPVSILKIPSLRFADSYFPGNSLWA